MWTSSAIPHISLFCHQQTHTLIFLFFLCTMHYILQTFIFTLYVSCLPFFLIDHNQKQVLLIKWVNSFLMLKNIFLLFSKWSNSRCFDVDQRCETRRWKQQHCFDVVQCCTFLRWHTQRCFNVDLTISDVATSYHPNNNCGTTLKGFLGIDKCCWKTT